MSTTHSYFVTDFSKVKKGFFAFNDQMKCISDLYLGDTIRLANGCLSAICNNVIIPDGSLSNESYSEKKMMYTLTIIYQYNHSIIHTLINNVPGDFMVVPGERMYSYDNSDISEDKEIQALWELIDKSI